MYGDAQSDSGQSVTTDSGGTRERLLEAAIGLMEHGGEAGLRIEQVAEIAGVSKASVYHFFGDREGLVVAALAHLYRRVMRRGFVDFDEILECETRDDFLSVLLRVVPSIPDADGAAARRRRVQILGSAVSRPELQAAIRLVHGDAVSELSRVVAYGQRRGWIGQHFAPKVLAEWWFGLVLGRHLLDDYGNEPEGQEWLRVTIAAVDALLSEGSAPPQP